MFKQVMHAASLHFKMSKIFVYHSCSSNGHISTTCTVCMSATDVTVFLTETETSKPL